jgi:predicted dehydrogenase
VIVPRAERSGVDDPIARQDRAFIDAVRGGTEPPVSGRAVRAAMNALEAAEQSYRSRLASLSPEAHHPSLP